MSSGCPRQMCIRDRHTLFHMLFIVLHGESGAAEYFSRFGQKDFFAGLLKKRHAVSLFKVMDMLGNSGLGKTCLLYTSRCV